jgi:hypothetical protein
VKTVERDGPSTFKNEVENGLDQAPQVVVDVHQTVMTEFDVRIEMRRGEGNLGKPMGGRVTIITDKGIVKY